MAAAYLGINSKSPVDIFSVEVGSSFYRIPQRAYSVNFYFDNIANLHGSDTAGGSDADYVARIKGHALREIMDEEGNRKDHVAGVPFLDLLAIQVGLYGQFGGI
jgi:hypothetical protein